MLWPKTVTYPHRPTLLCGTDSVSRGVDRLLRGKYVAQGGQFIEKLGGANVKPKVQRRILFFFREICCSRRGDVNKNFKRQTSSQKARGGGNVFSGKCVAQVGQFIEKLRGVNRPARSAEAEVIFQREHVLLKEGANYRKPSRGKTSSQNTRGVRQFSTGKCVFQGDVMYGKASSGKMSSQTSRGAGNVFSGEMCWSRRDDLQKTFEG